MTIDIVLPANEANEALHLFISAMREFGADDADGQVSFDVAVALLRNGFETIKQVSETSAMASDAARPAAPDYLGVKRT